MANTLKVYTPMLSLWVIISWSRGFLTTTCATFGLSGRASTLNQSMMSVSQSTSNRTSWFPSSSASVAVTWNRKFPSIPHIVEVQITRKNNFLKKIHVVACRVKTSNNANSLLPKCNPSKAFL